MPISLAFRKVISPLLCFGLGCLAPHVFAQADPADTFADGAVRTVHLMPKVVTTSKIANNAITDSRVFADNSVGTDEIADNSLGSSVLGEKRGAVAVPATGSDPAVDQVFAGLTGYWEARHIADGAIKTERA